MIILNTFFHVALLAALSWYLWKQEKELRVFAVSGLWLKILSGCAVGLLYMDHYGAGDTLHYFRDAATLADVARNDVSSYLYILQSSTAVSLDLVLVEPRAFFLTKIASLFALISMNNYWVISAYLSALSFLGSWRFVIMLRKYIPQLYVPGLFSFVFFPSVVFWTSGLIKESISFGSLIFLASIFLQGWFEKRLPALLFVAGLFAAWILWSLKYYYLAIFGAVAATSLLQGFVFSPLFRIRKRRQEVFLWICTTLALMALAMTIHPNFAPDRFMTVIVENHDAFLRYSENHDVIHFSSLSPTIFSMLQNAPLALTSSLFRPFIWEATNALQILAALENLVVLLLFISSLFNLKRVATYSSLTLVLGVATYVIVLGIFLALSTPNFGTLIRYRIGFYPFFLLIVLSNNPLTGYIQSLSLFRNM